MNFSGSTETYFECLREAAQAEAWKYSPVSAFASKDWTPSPAAQVSTEAKGLRDRLKQNFDVLVVMNGRVTLNESALSSSDLKITTDNLRLELPENKTLNRPLAIIYGQSAGEHWGLSRLQISLGQNSEMHLAEWFIGNEQGLRSHHCEVAQAKGSRLHWVRVVRDSLEGRFLSFSTTQIEREAELNYGLLQGGAVWSRGEWTVDIRGEGASCNVLGLNFGRDQQHADQRVVVNHWAANTQSSQLFKGILKDRARGVLNGRIFIAPDAQKVNSSQLNHNLILSPGAEADTKPELEIYADDVKANHGASIGRMDENKLFYLMSRGIPRSEAQRVLARAFVEDVIMKVKPKTLRDLMEAAVDEVLPDFNAQMEAGQ